MRVDISTSVISVSANADSNVCMFQEGRGSGREDWIQDSTGWVHPSTFFWSPLRVSSPLPLSHLPSDSSPFFSPLPGRNIFRVVFRSGQIERNELFLPGRMAYVVDLDDEFTDTDIPTTLIRSKADCPSMEVQLYFHTAAGLLLDYTVLQHTQKELKSIANTDDWKRSIFSSATTVLLHVLFLLIVRVFHRSLVVRWYLSAALMTCLISVVMLLCFRLRRLWQPMTSWSRSWLRSCRTFVKGHVTRRWRRRTKVKQRFLSRQNKDTRIHRGHHEELDRHRV